MAKKKCFVADACSFKCPNEEVYAINYYYGSRVAEDMGLTEIECNYCTYNSGECKDCLFEGGEDCPEWGAATTNKRL